MRLCDAYTWTPEAGDVALFKSKTDEFVSGLKYARKGNVREVVERLSLMSACVQLGRFLTEG